MQKQCETPSDDGSTAEEWEDGDLGQSTEHAVRSSREREEMIHKMIDEATDLKMISIRLQEGLIDALKAIAERKGIGYQPLVRQVLNEYVREECGE
jgi:predicted DNA binding CopG/RHH family protein